MASLNLHLHPKQAEALHTEATELLFGGAAGPGKALALDTVIPTPEGWVRQGDLRPGDRVFDEAGQICNVLAVTPPLLGRPCLRIAFDDGSAIIADAAHEWLTFNVAERTALVRRSPEFRAKRRARRPLRGSGKKPWLAEKNSNRSYDVLHAPAGGIRTTEMIGKTLRNASGRSNHFIPVCPGLQIDNHELPIDPYILGAWLGDGTSSSGAITCAEDDIREEMRRRGRELIHWKSSKYCWNIVGLKKQLMEIGLLKNKHIPPQYLRSSYDQRMDLLRGLMDTDGTIDTDGQCEFTNCNRRLIEGVAELIRSLGIKARINEGIARLYGKDCGPKYRIHFATTKAVFILSRKVERLLLKERGVQGWRVVQSVSPVESVPVCCIMVDSSSHLYLAGESMIPTHNSFFLRAASVLWASEIPGLQVYLFRRLSPDLIKNHIEGPKGYRALLAPWSQAGFVRIVEDEIRFWNGSKIYLCHCKDEKDRFKYQGSEIHVLLIDELTHFSDVIYRFLRGRVRMVGIKLPAKFHGMFPRIACGSNPGNVGHQFVKSTFIDGAPAGEVRLMGPDEGGMLRQFIRGRLEDNPSMAQDDPGYEDKLSGLGNPALVRAMREGDWDIVEGAFFTEWSRARHVLRPVALPEFWLRFRSGDWGSAKPYAFNWFAVASDDWQHPDGVIVPRGALICYRELYGIRTRPDGSYEADVGVKQTAEEVAKRILSLEAEDEEIKYGVLDPAAFASDGGPSIGERMAKAGVWFGKADNKRVATRGALGGHDHFRNRLKGDGDGRPMLYFFANCLHSIRTIPVLQHDDKRAEDIDTDMEDHAYDSARYGVMSRPWVAKAPPPPFKDRVRNPKTMEELEKWFDKRNSKEKA